jgi:predicted GNAT family N-acyltransferase
MTFMFLNTDDLKRVMLECMILDAEAEGNTAKARFLKKKLEEMNEAKRAVEAQGKEEMKAFYARHGMKMDT